MSKIGRQPIDIPEGVEVKIENNNIIAKGKEGELAKQMSQGIKVEVKDKQIILFPSGQDKKASAIWGTNRALIFNLIKGVSEGFEKKLEIEGVGYRASVEGDKLILSLGFSHPVEVKAPAGITFDVKKNLITIAGIDKEIVGQVAATIRAHKKPEPYKGKGIRYQGEKIRRKAGKKAVASA